jgi:hypothetical protein
VLPELRSIVLEGVHFIEGAICRWLFIQPKLKHITLIRPYLHGRWESLVERWSAEPDFKLESLELKSPWDFDVDRQEEVEDAGTSKVPSRVSSDAVLRYVNHGGDNPFAYRRWKTFNWRGQGEEWNDERDGNISDYSDFSEYLPDDHASTVDDPNGPEFDSDYDFDNETESDPGLEEAESANSIDGAEEDHEDAEGDGNDGDDSD